MITVALADDHKVVREGLRALLSAEENLSVVGEAADGLAALEVVQKSAPDVLVLDLLMPGLSGLDVTRRVAQDFPKTKVVVLTMHANEAYVAEALKNGARGFVLKEAGKKELLEAVHKAAAGEQYLSPTLSPSGVEAYMNALASRAPDRYEKLTTREREVFQLASEGNSNPEIGRRLSISPRTVEDHRAAIMRKLNVKNQTELVRFALRRGMLPLGE